jgi:acetoin utilization deacetylase AcuC-like enzyme
MLPLPRVDWSEAWGRVQRFLFGRSFPAFYDRAYRLPIPVLETSAGMTLRRADDVAWYLVDQGIVGPRDLRAPPRAQYEDVARVHHASYLESLGRAETLARIFAVDPGDVPVDEVLASIRLGCGGTLAAARTALARKGPALNLFGGFHHAAPGRGGGFCAVNDIAVAVRALRADGYQERIVILDLDAHPPDGTAECLVDDPAVWIGSISAAEWGPLAGIVDETVLPEGTGDAVYLHALDALLGRLPESGLAFVLAGGDVLAGDRLGRLAMTLEGARERDVRVFRALRDRPSVWLPAGGYHEHAWRVFAGAGLVLSGSPRRQIPQALDPVALRFAQVSGRLEPARLYGDLALTAEDHEGELGGIPHQRRGRLLDFYSAEGIEYGLHQLGILGTIERLGYTGLRVVVDKASEGDRVRLLGRAAGQDQVLIECVLGRHHLDSRDLLYLHWLTLRHPRARFEERRPKLPGQEVPGLGVGREIYEALTRIAARLNLAGLALRPAWYHVAFLGRRRFQFHDPAREAEFRAMVRDLGELPLKDVSHAAATGVLLKDGQPYRWEPDLMVAWFEPPEPVPPAAARFSLV